MGKEIPKYIKEKMRRIEKYRDEIGNLAGEVTDWMWENGVDGINDSDISAEMYELKYGCGSTEELVSLTEKKIKEGE